MKIKIKRNTLGDTRTAERVPTFIEFSNSNRSHVSDVSNMMDGIAEKIRMAGVNHDWSKMREPYKSIFYRDLCNVINQNMC